MDIREQLKQIIDDFTEEQAKIVLDFINDNFELVTTEEDLKAIERGRKEISPPSEGFFILGNKLTRFDKLLSMVDGIVVSENKMRVVFMKKNYKILISIGIVLVVAITSGVVFQVNKKISYETAIRFIKAGQLSEANEILNNLKKYKNTEILLKYIDALKISKEYPSIAYIQANSINAIPIDYSGDLSKEINDYRMQIKQMETDSIKREEEAIIEIFKKGDYDGMATKCFKNNRYSVLYYYAQAIISEKKGDHDMAIYYLASEIPSNYSGLMADEVHQTLNTYSDEIKQEKKLLASIEAEKSKKYPEIGMTEEQLLCSKWGKPIKVNKTTTSFGISEQWVYSADRYVYLKNGIVTAIQQ